MTITILLVDDHHVVRQGLRSLLALETDFQVIAEASDGLEAVRTIDQLRPQVSIVDLMMPGLGGLEVTRQVCQWTRVLILSMHDNEAYVMEALRNGAYGYVLKDSTAEELIWAVRVVAEGRRFLSSPFSERAISSYSQKVQEGSLDPYDRLTTREREVLHLAAEGLTAGDMSARLSISPRDR